MGDKKQCTAEIAIKAGDERVRCDGEAGHAGWHTYCGYYGGIGTPRCVYQTSWSDERSVKVIVG